MQVRLIPLGGRKGRHCGRAATGFCPGMGLLVEPALAITSRRRPFFLRGYRQAKLKLVRQPLQGFPHVHMQAYMMGH